MDIREELGYRLDRMFKKIEFRGQNYGDLDKLDKHDLKREKLHSFYQTFDFLDLVKIWPEIVGVNLSKVTSPLKIKGDSLIIVSKHASYSQNLSFLSEEIKGKIFTHFPQLRSIVRKIHFQTGEDLFQTPNKLLSDKEVLKIHPQDPRYKIKKNEADKLFEGVEDQELKKILTSIYLQI